jgi:phosphatidylinositol dimannoside acyltransferase
MTLAARLREPRLVPLLADRDLSRRGIGVTLLGESTRMPAGPALLAVRTGSALLPVSLWYEGAEPDHRLVVRFHEELEPPTGVRGAERIARLTQDLADEFSRSIAAHARDWHMLQPLFLADLPEGDPRRTVPSGAGG